MMVLGGVTSVHWMHVFWVSSCMITNAKCKRCSRRTAFGSSVLLHRLKQAKILSLQACLKIYCYHNGLFVIKANQLKLNHVKQNWYSDLGMGFALFTAKHWPMSIRAQSTVFLVTLHELLWLHMNYFPWLTGKNNLTDILKCFIVLFTF